MSGKGHLKWSKDQHFVDPAAFLLPGAFLAFMTQPMICEIECCIKITLPTPFTWKNIKVQLRSPDDIPAVEEAQQETGIFRGSDPIMVIRVDYMIPSYCFTT